MGKTIIRKKGAAKADPKDQKKVDDQALAAMKAFHEAATHYGTEAATFRAPDGSVFVFVAGHSDHTNCLTEWYAEHFPTNVASKRDVGGDVLVGGDDIKKMEPA